MTFFLPSLFPTNQYLFLPLHHISVSLITEELGWCSVLNIRAVQHKVAHVNSIFHLLYF